MRKYTVIAVLTIQAGAILGLTHSQAAARSHALKTIERDDKAQMGAYEVLSPVQFKVGETLFAADELNKALATALEPEEDTKAKARDKARADAAAKDLAALKAKAKQWDEVEPELAGLRDKAKAFDDLQADLEALQTKAALWDMLPEPVRAEAMQKAEAEIRAADKASKK